MESSKVKVQFRYFDKSFNIEGHRYKWPKAVPIKNVIWANWFSIEINPKKEPVVILIYENADGKLAGWYEHEPVKDHLARIMIKALNKQKNNVPDLAKVKSLKK